MKGQATNLAWSYGAASPTVRQILIGPRTTRVAFTTPFVFNSNLSCALTKDGRGTALTGGTPLGASAATSWVDIPAGLIADKSGSDYALACFSFTEGYGVFTGMNQTVTWNFAYATNAPVTATVGADAAKLVASEKHVYWDGSATWGDPSPPEMPNIHPGERVRLYAPRDTWPANALKPTTIVEIWDYDKTLYGEDVVTSSDGSIIGFTIPDEVALTELAYVSIASNASITGSGSTPSTTIDIWGGFYVNFVGDPELPPLPSSPKPVISGTAQPQYTLTAGVGTWAPSPVSYTYQWRRGGSPIIGATSSTYKILNADVGEKLNVAVTGSSPGYAPMTRTSSPMEVTARSLTAAPMPTITGASKVGSTLTAKSAAWLPSSVALQYQWMRGGFSIAGATTATLKLTAADANASISVAITGTKTGYASQTKTSAAQKVTPATLTATPKPTIAGTAKAGSTLKATVGTWSPSPVTLSYQWKRAGSPIAGATSSTYKLVTADRGKAVTFTVTGSKPGYTTVIKSSDSKTVSK